MSRIRITRRTRNIVIGLVAAAGAAFIAIPAAGADFTASDNGATHEKTATLTIGLGDPAHGMTGSFDLVYANMAPGDVQGQQFTVWNTGSIPAAVSLTNRNQGGTNTAGLTGADWEELTAGVYGYSSMVKSNVGLNADLGTLQPGESRTYRLDMGLARSAGNEWQGVTVNSNVVVTLKQLP